MPTIMDAFEFPDGSVQIIPEKTAASVPDLRRLNNREFRAWWRNRQMDGTAPTMPPKMPELRRTSTAATEKPIEGPPTQESPRKKSGCGSCGQRAKKRSIMQMAKGAVGITKEVLGIDAASDEVVEQRWSLCVLCDQFDHGVCTGCGCHLSAKIRVASEQCPAEKWPDVDTSDAESGSGGGLGDPVAGAASS